MARAFIAFDLTQPFLLPPDIRDWLPEGHLARFILDLVDTLDFTANAFGVGGPRASFNSFNHKEPKD